MIAPSGARATRSAGLPRFLPGVIAMPSAMVIASASACWFMALPVTMKPSLASRWRRPSVPRSGIITHGLS